MNKNYRRFIAFFLIFPLTALACGLSVSRPEPTAPAQPPATEYVLATPERPAAEVLPSLVTNEDAVLTELYKQVNPSVVNITTFVEDRDTIIFSAQGSGFLYDYNGHIVTNSHVVHGSDSLEVDFANGETFEAEIIGQDLHSDLAVIKIQSLPSGVQPLTLGNIDNIEVGQTVVAIGNPFGLGGTLTRGIVSAMGRTIPALTSFSIPQAIQTDAPINPGNSGGPLLNLRGEVIGVNAQIETDGTSRTNSGIGYAIPVSIVEKVVPELIANGKYVWGWLGVRGGDLTFSQIKAMKLKINNGAYISEVVDNGPSDKAGLIGSKNTTSIDGRRVEVGGDVIIQIDGQSVISFDDILNYIALETSPGQTVELTIIRDNLTEKIQVTLEPRPSEVMTMP